MFEPVLNMPLEDAMTPLNFLINSEQFISLLILSYLFIWDLKISIKARIFIKLESFKN